eukprot:403332787
MCSYISIELKVFKLHNALQHTIFKQQNQQTQVTSQQTCGSVIRTQVSSSPQNFKVSNVYSQSDTTLNWKNDVSQNTWNRLAVTVKYSTGSWTVYRNQYTCYTNTGAFVRPIAPNHNVYMCGTGANLNLRDISIWKRELALSEIKQLLYQYQSTELYYSELAAYYLLSDSEDMYRAYDYGPSKSNGYFQKFQTLMSQAESQQMTVYSSLYYDSYPYKPAYQTSSANQYTDILTITSTIELPAPKTYRTADHSYTVEFWYRWSNNPNNQVFAWVTQCLAVSTSSPCQGFALLRQGSGGGSSLVVQGGGKSNSFNPSQNLQSSGSWVYIAGSYNDFYDGSYQAYYEFMVNQQVQSQRKNSEDGGQLQLLTTMYLAVPEISTTTFSIYMKEIRFWTPMRPIHDLLYFQNRDLSWFNAVNLFGYWKIEKDIYNLKRLVDKCPYYYGQHEITNNNYNWISNPDGSFRICTYKTQGSSCSAETQETETLRAFTTQSSESNREINIQSSDPFIVEFWAYPSYSSTIQNRNTSSTGQYCLFAEFLNCGGLEPQYYTIVDLIFDNTLDLTTPYAYNFVDFSCYLEVYNTNNILLNKNQTDLATKQVSIYFNRALYGTFTQDPAKPGSQIKIGTEGFNGYLKEIKLYTDFDSSFDLSNHRQMMHKNYRSLISTPTYYPFLREYYRMSGSPANTYNFRNLANYQSSIVQFNSFSCLTSATGGGCPTYYTSLNMPLAYSATSNFLFCRNGNHFDGISCRNDHMTLTQVDSSSSTVNLGQHYDLDNRAYWSVVFWFSHKQDQTTEDVVRTNTSLFIFTSSRQDTTSSSSGTVLLCGTSKTLYSSKVIGAQWQINQKIKYLTVGTTYMQGLLMETQLAMYQVLPEIPNFFRFQVGQQDFAPLLHRFYFIWRIGQQTNAILYNRINMDYIIWINETVNNYYDQPFSPSRGKNFLWDFDPYSPRLCNGTSQSLLEVDNMLDCAEMINFQQNTASNQCMKINYDTYFIRDANNYLQANRALTITFWAKIQFVKTNQTNATILLFNTGQDFIRMSGVTYEYEVNWSSSNQFAMEMQTTIQGRDVDGTTPLQFTLNDEQRDTNRCNNDWCFYFFTKGSSGGTNMFYAGKNTKVYGPVTFDYTYFQLDGLFQIGCLGYSYDGSTYSATQLTQNLVLRDLRFMNSYFGSTLTNYKQIYTRWYLQYVPSCFLHLALDFKSPSTIRIYDTSYVNFWTNLRIYYLYSPTAIMFDTTNTLHVIDDSAWDYETSLPHWSGKTMPITINSVMNEWTLAFWVYTRDNYGNNYNYVSGSVFFKCTPIVEMSQNSGIITIKRGSISYTTQADYNYNQWNHFTLVYTSSFQGFYWKGLFRDSPTNLLPISATTSTITSLQYTFIDNLQLWQRQMGEDMIQHFMYKKVDPAKWKPLLVYYFLFYQHPQLEFGGYMWSPYHQYGTLEYTLSNLNTDPITGSLIKCQQTQQYDMGLSECKTSLFPLMSKDRGFTNLNIGATQISLFPRTDITNSEQWHHYNLQIDTVTPATSYFKCLVDNTVMNPTSGVNLNSYSLSGLWLTNITTICPDQSCGYFGIKSLKIWKPVFQYTSFAQLLEGANFFTNSLTILGFWEFDEGYSTLIWDELYNVRSRNEIYSKVNQQVLPVWADIHLFDLNVGTQTKCYTGYYYDTLREQCILKDPAIMTLEFQQQTSNNPVLDFSTYTFTKDWTLEFFFRWEYYNMIISPNQEIEVLSVDPTCTALGTKLKRFYLKKGASTSSILYMVQQYQDSALTTTLNSGSSCSQRPNTWYIYSTANSQLSNKITMYRENTCSISDNNAMEKLASCPILIGKGSSTINNVRFFFKEIRIWNTALTQDQYLAYQRLSHPWKKPNLAAYIKLDDKRFYDYVQEKEMSQTSANFQVTYNGEYRNNCGIGMQFYSSNCQLWAGQQISLQKYGYFEKDLSTIMTSMYNDNDFSFTISFHLDSDFDSTTGLISTQIILIESLFQVSYIDENSFLFQFDLNSGSNGFAYVHNKAEYHYTINFQPHEKKIEFYVGTTLESTLTDIPMSEYKLPGKIRIGSNSGQVQDFNIKYLTMYYPAVPFTKIKNKFQNQINWKSHKFDHTVLLDYQILYHSYYEIKDQFRDMVTDGNNGWTATNITISTASISQFQYGNCPAGMNQATSSQGLGCLPFLDLQTVIRFELSTSKSLQVKTTKATGSYSQTTSNLNTFSTMKQWYGLSATHDIDGNWKIYLTQSASTTSLASPTTTILLTPITDVYKISYEGMLTKLQFGDIQKLGHWLKIKNIYGIAKPLGKSEIQQNFYRQISELYFKRSLLFHYKLDEDQGVTFYDSSMYENHIVGSTTLASSSTDNWIIWDKSWDLIFGNAEVSTTDHVSYFYKEKGLLFKNGLSQNLRLLDLTSMTQEYSLEFCLYLTSFNNLATIFTISGLSQTTLISSPTKSVQFEPKLGTNLALSIDGYELNRWNCFIEGNSVIYNQAYICADISSSHCSKSTTGYASSVSPPLTFYIGGASGQLFTGHLQNLKIYSTYRTIGQAHASFRRKPSFSYEQNQILAYYDLMDSHGDTVLEYVSGNSVMIGTLNEWVMLPDKLKLCEWDTKYSSRGYCQVQEKFLELTGDLEIKVETEYTGCSTLAMWQYLKTLNIFEVQFEDRYRVKWSAISKEVQIINTTSDVLCKLKDISTKYLNKWIFMSYKVCDAAETAMISAIYMDSTNTAVINDLNQKDSLIFTFLNDTTTKTLKFTFTSNSPRQNDHTLLKFYYKFNEWAGEYLYNYATDAQSDDYLYQPTCYKWVYWIDITGSTIEDEMFFCQDYGFKRINNKHCERYTCDSSCEFSKECTGLASTDCVTVPSDSVILYNTDEYYLDCHIYCDECTVPFINSLGTCTSCGDSFWMLNKTKECYMTCPSDYFEFIDATAGENYCVKCDNLNCTCYSTDIYTCTGCVDSMQIFITSPGAPNCYDNCFQVEGLNDTYYDAVRAVCKQCDEKCGTCWGPSSNECYSCVGKNKLVSNSSCQEITCGDGYYLDEASYVCKECDSTCLTCNSPGTASDCVTCVPDRMIDIDSGLCKQCNEITGYQYPIKRSLCAEVCGDGLNMGQLECDDGNIRGGDGCNSDCQVERGWNCYGGDTETADYCKYTINPQPTIVKYTSDNQFWIGFSQTMVGLKSGKLSEAEFEVKMEPSKSFTYTAVVPDNFNKTQQIQVKITPKASLTGKETLIFTFKNAEDIYYSKKYPYLSLQDNSQVQSVAQTYSFIDAGKLEAIKKTGDATSSGLQTFMIINLAINVVLGGAMQMMWELINMLQILNYLPLLQIYHPELLLNTLVFLQKAQGDFNIPYSGTIMAFVVNTTNINDYPYNSQFYDFGIESTTFLILYQDQILMWSVGLTFLPLIIFLSNKFINKDHFFAKLVRWIEDKIRYSFFLRAFVEAYLQMTLYTFINLMSIKLENKDEKLSSAVGMLFLVQYLCITHLFQFICCILPLFTIELVQKNFDNFDKPPFCERFSSLIEGLKIIRPKTIYQMWLPIFFLRRFIYVVTLTLMINYPTLQLCISAGCSFFILMWVVIIKPFEKRIFNIINMINESVIFITFLICFNFRDTLSEDVGEKYSFGIIGGMMFATLVSVVAMIYYTTKLIAQRIRKCRLVILKLFKKATPEQLSQLKKMQQREKPYMSYEKYQEKKSINTKNQTNNLKYDPEQQKWRAIESIDKQANTKIQDVVMTEQIFRKDMQNKKQQREQKKQERLSQAQINRKKLSNITALPESTFDVSNVMSPNVMNQKRQQNYPVRFNWEQQQDQYMNIRNDNLPTSLNSSPDNRQNRRISQVGFREPNLAARINPSHVFRENAHLAKFARIRSDSNTGLIDEPSISYDLSHKNPQSPVRRRSSITSFQTHSSFNNTLNESSNKLLLPTLNQINEVYHDDENSLNSKDQHELSQSVLDQFIDEGRDSSSKTMSFIQPSLKFDDNLDPNLQAKYNQNYKIEKHQQNQFNKSKTADIKNDKNNNFEDDPVAYRE